MSDTRKRLVEVANELTDIVAQYEETQHKPAEWNTDAWQTAITNMLDEGTMFWGFDHRTDPTAVVHEIYTAYKDMLEAYNHLERGTRGVPNRFAPEPVAPPPLRDVELRQMIRAADELTGTIAAQRMLHEPLRVEEMGEILRGPDVARF